MLGKHVRFLLRYIRIWSHSVVDFATLCNRLFGALGGNRTPTMTFVASYSDPLNYKGLVEMVGFEPTVGCVWSNCIGPLCYISIIGAQGRIWTDESSALQAVPLTTLVLAYFVENVRFELQFYVPNIVCYRITLHSLFLLLIYQWTNLLPLMDLNHGPSH